MCMSSLSSPPHLVRPLHDGVTVVIASSDFPVGSPALVDAVVWLELASPPSALRRVCSPGEYVRTRRAACVLLCLVMRLRWNIHTAIARPSTTAMIPRVLNIDLLCMETRDTSVWWLEWSVPSP
jgi:hypothetical protein